MSLVSQVLAVSVTDSTSWLNQATNSDGSKVADNSSFTFNGSTSLGTGASQSDRLFHDQRTVNGGANDDLDLTNLSMIVLGMSVTIAMVQIRTLKIINLSNTPGDVLLLDSTVLNAYLGFLDGIAGSKPPIKANGVLSMAAILDGYGATSGTNKILRINNPGSRAITYQIVIGGTSA